MRIPGILQTASTNRCSFPTLEIKARMHRAIDTKVITAPKMVDNKTGRKRAIINAAAMTGTTILISLML
jgi:hypothetical protein